MGRGVPELVLELNGSTWTLDPSRPYTLGRDPQGDLTIDDARVSWRHATIGWDGRSWFIEDHGSTNGTYVQGQRVQRTEIGVGAAVRLGNATDGPRLNLTAAAGHSAQPAVAHQAPANQQHPQQAPAHQQHAQQAPAHQQHAQQAPAPQQQHAQPGAAAWPGQQAPGQHQASPQHQAPGQHQASPQHQAPGQHQASPQHQAPGQHQA
ncbi:FHA domain-containing protein, partial [Streptomyces sp. NPDC088744]|uniref:FHA domain-containing protein n=1 Tax=Streptomyces sp. NPDC088744 TaxID=3155061 RepID=UPI00344D3237